MTGFLLLTLPGAAWSQQFGQPLRTTQNFHLQQGISQYESGDPEGAIESLEWALEEDGEAAEVYIYLSSAYLLSGRHGEAAELAARGIELFPDLVRLYAVKGEAIAQTNLAGIIPVYEAMRALLLQRPGREADGITVRMVENTLGAVHEQLGGQYYTEGETAKAADAFRNALRYTGDNPMLHNNLAFLLMQLQQYEEARQVLDSALIRFPESQNLVFLRAQLAGETGETEAAVRLLAQLWEADASDVNRGLAYGISLFNNNQPPDANALFEELLERFPEEPRVYDTLIEINRQRMDLRGLSRVLNLRRLQFPDDEETARAYGESLIAASDFDEAFTFYDTLAASQAEAGQPVRAAESGRLAARALLFSDEPEQALAYYERLLAEEAVSPVLFREAGLLAAALGQRDRAYTLLSSYAAESAEGRLLVKTAGLAPPHEEGQRVREASLKAALDTSWQGFAEWLLLSDSLRQAAVQTDTLTAIIGRMFRTYARGQQLVQQDAEQDMETLNPTEPVVFQTGRELEEMETYISQALRFVTERMQAAQAAAVMDRLSEQLDESPLLMVYQAALAERMNEPEQALSWLTEALRSGAASADIHLSMARLYRGQNQTEMALLAFERALTVDPSNRRAYRGIVDLSQESGRLDELADRWLARYRANPRNENLREFLTETLHKAGRFTEAREL
ncbi:MAG: tetratricopeptide repeat protein [Candidatus Cyclonatronum sp.]|uniref:tetratricopeptide repeat protein n=1 Tax=Cyclonatronum sp. TaxID=3024185 RepID=UPI0025C680F4|nr:tetratricopeptide repeat protein [Cyclonatronum sp.]MCH8488043.1 tetratricopeptide repeat protein [Cyclonatronum sp.]